MIPAANDLRYFIEVATELNLSRAADNLQISQPSLSLAIRRIENLINTAVFIRHKRGVTLTVAGKKLLNRAKQLFSDWEEIKGNVLASVTDTQGEFSIGCHPTVALNVLPKFLSSLLVSHPRLNIKLEHNLSRKLAEQVIDLKLDIGIIVNPVKHPDLVIKKLYDDKITIWYEPTVTKSKSTQDNTVLFLDPNLIQTQYILKKMKSLQLNIQRTVKTHHLELIADLVKSGAGFGIIPSSVANQKGLKIFPGAPYFLDEICLVYRGENRHIKGIQTIVRAIQETFK